MQPKKTGPADFTLPLAKGRPTRMLWLSDMQIIDPEARRYPERLSAGEIAAWAHGSEWRNYIYQIDRMMRQERPDFVIVTGDMTYGSFDDAGDTLRGFVRVMEGYGVPWLPVWGNHDNESAMGVSWQCAQLEGAAHCLFRRGEVTGNSNYTVALTADGVPVRMLYMLDSNGCAAATDPAVRKESGFAPDQMAWVAQTAARLPVPAFLAFHMPTEEYYAALTAAGYQPERDRGQEHYYAYTIGEDVDRRGADCGRKDSYLKGVHPQPGFLELCRRARVDGVFAAHTHRNNFSVLYERIRWSLANKCGLYDYHLHGQTGGTLVLLGEDGAFLSLRHLYVEEPVPQTRP